MESQTRSSKRALRKFNPLPTFRQPFANLSPTLCQPFLPTPLQPPLSVNPRHPFRDTRVNGFLEKVRRFRGVPNKAFSPRKGLISTVKGASQWGDWAGGGGVLRGGVGAVGGFTDNPRGAPHPQIPRRHPRPLGIWVGTSRIWKKLMQETLGWFFVP